MKTLYLLIFACATACATEVPKPQTPAPVQKEDTWTIYTQGEKLTCNWYRGSTAFTWEIEAGKTDTIFYIGTPRIICSCQNKTYLSVKQNDKIYFEGVTNIIDIR